MSQSTRPEASTVAAPRCIVVLGMHRSGTSALMGSLRQAGVYLGKVLDHGFALNPKGLQEPAAVLYMHENLLQANGGCWHEPPATVEWSPMHMAVRDLFIESREGRPLWGFKDPRTVLVLDGWRKVLPGLEAVGIFRHPAEVASSLQGRNAFPIEKCFAIWTRYNRHLLEQHERQPFPLIEFVADPDAMADSIDRVLAQLRLTPTVAPDFIDTSLRRFDATAAAIPVPDEAADLYARLQQRAASNA